MWENLLVSGLGGLTNALSPAVGDMLGLNQSVSDNIQQQAAAFQSNYAPIIKQLMEESMNKGAYSAAGTQGAGQVADAYKRQQDRYTGMIAPQEQSQINNLNNLASDALSNVGTQDAIARNQFGSSMRTQGRNMMDIARNQGPGASYKMAEGLGDANRQMNEQLLSSSANNYANASQLAGSLGSKAGEMGMQSKQQVQNLFVDPYKRQQESSLSGIASTGFSSGIGNVGSTNKLMTDPLSGISNMLTSQANFSQGISNLQNPQYANALKALRGY